MQPAHWVTMGRCICPQHRRTHNEARDGGKDSADDHGDGQTHTGGGDGVYQALGGNHTGEGTHAHKAGVPQTQLTEDTHGEVQGYGHGHIAADGDQQAGHGAVQDSGAVEQRDGHIEDHNTEIGGEIHGIGPTEFLKFHSGHLTLSRA